MVEQTVSIQVIREFCKGKASDLRTAAAQERSGSFSSASSRDKAIEFEAKAQTLDHFLEDLISSQTGSEQLASIDDIDDIARAIDPKTFARFDATIIRLRNEGRDDAYVIQAAEVMYGEAIERARASARKTIENKTTDSVDEPSYKKGLQDAVAWHERHAKDADQLETSETRPNKKVALQKRSARHRLYANAIRKNFRIE